MRLPTIRLHAPLVRLSRRCATIAAAALVVAVLLPAAAAGSERIPVDDSSIVKVTVYRDRAEVVREGTVHVPGGPSTVEFGGLPDGVEADALRVSAQGTPAALGAVEIRTRVEKPHEPEELEAVREAIRGLEREIAALDQDAEVDERLRGFLDAVADANANREARELGEGRADAAGVSTLYALMETKLRALGKSGLDREDAKRELKEQLNLEQARLATLRPAPEIRSRVGSVEIEAERAGALTVRLTYFVSGASWRPSYRATLGADSSEVELVAEGVVRQKTGEDWRGVEMVLSSATPSAGVQPPMLMPWVLRPVPAFRARGRTADMEEDSYKSDLPVPGRFYQNVLALAPGVADAGEVSVQPETELSRSAYNVVFRVPGRTDVPADGNERRVVLRRELLEAKLVHRTVPGLDPRAFLTAVTTSPREYPLLAGPVRVFAGTGYLGSFQLDETAPGIELTLPFGADNRVEIVRVPEPDTHSQEGLTGKQRQVHAVERTIIHNLMDHAIVLVLEDRLPVSEDERVEVRLGKETTPGYRDSERRPGVKLWTLELAAGERREMLLDYTVRYPRELRVPGVD